MLRICRVNLNRALAIFRASFLFGVLTVTTSSVQAQTKQ